MVESIIGVLDRMLGRQYTNVYSFDLVAYLTSVSPNVKTFLGQSTVLRQTFGQGVNKIEYVTCDLTELDTLISQCVDDTSVIELLTKHSEYYEYIPGNFKFYKRLKRMTSSRCISNKINSNIQNGNKTRITTADSINFLVDSFNGYYDPLVERIPSTEEMREIINAGKCIQIISPNSEPVGFFIYNDHNSNHELRYIFIDPKFRGKSYGERLLVEFLQTSTHIKRCSLWVLEDNERAIGLYVKYGFSFDGLNCWIFRSSK